METSNPNLIVMYGTSWCGDTRRARAYFAKNQIEYQWVDIDYDASGRAIVEKINHGYRSVPTIIFPDGDILVEPSEEQLIQKFSKSE